MSDIGPWFQLVGGVLAAWVILVVPFKRHKSELRKHAEELGKVVSERDTLQSKLDNYQKSTLRQGDNPGSTAYLDTCTAVDREMEHRKELSALREGVEKLAEEYTRLADTSDDEDFITEKRALARELRALLK